MIFPKIKLNIWRLQTTTPISVLQRISSKHLWKPEILQNTGIFERVMRSSRPISMAEYWSQYLRLARNSERARSSLNSFWELLSAYGDRKLTESSICDRNFWLSNNAFKIGFSSSWFTDEFPYYIYNSYNLMAVQVSISVVSEVYRSVYILRMKILLNYLIKYCTMIFLVYDERSEFVYKTL